MQLIVKVFLYYVIEKHSRPTNACTSLMDLSITVSVYSVIIDSKTRNKKRRQNTSKFYMNRIKVVTVIFTMESWG